MTKSELIARLAARNPHLYQRDVERIVATVFDEISKALAAGHRVELRGFGAFSVKKRDPRTGRNPRTGEQVAVASKRVPYFKTGKDLRDRLNKEAARAAGLLPAETATRRTPESDKTVASAQRRRGRCAHAGHAMKFLSRALFLLFILIGVLIAVSNSQPVQLALWPLPHVVVMPVYLLVIARAAAGRAGGSRHGLVGRPPSSPPCPRGRRRGGPAGA